MAQSTQVKIIAELQGNKALIRITERISSDAVTGSSYIRSQIDSFQNQGIKEATLYINCGGGDVFEAVEICNELDRFDTVTIKVGAKAASAATYFLTRFYSTAKPNSQIMIHRPKLTTHGDIPAIQNDLKLLENATNDYKLSYARKTGLAPEAIEQLWNKGDVWLTAQEALKMKLIDAIEETEPAREHPLVNARHELQLVALEEQHTNWTLEDYLDNDPKAYEHLRTQHPAKAQQLEAAYFGTTFNDTISNQEEPNAIQGDRSTWTLEDYLEKDVQAYREMKINNPERAKRLEAAYFGS